MGGHDEVTLTARERRALSEIESITTQLDPALVRRLTGRSPARRVPPVRVRLAAAAAAFVVAAVVVVATFVWSTAVAFAASLVMAGAIFVAATAVQDLSGTRPPTPVRVRSSVRRAL